MKLDTAWLVSLVVHGVVFVWLDAGEPKSRSRDVVPFELVEFVPAEAMPEPEPEVEPEPEPMPVEPELPPEPEPAPEPPPRREPPPAVSPPVDVDPAPAAEAATPSSVVLDLTLSNVGSSTEVSGRGGTGDGSESASASATPSKPKPKRSACREAPTRPTPLTKAPIEYPATARERGQHGRVTLVAIVDKQGRVTDVDVVESAGNLLDEAMARALRQWTFAPATACGRPVTGRYPIRRTFELGG